MSTTDSLVPGVKTTSVPEEVLKAFKSEAKGDPTFTETLNKHLLKYDNGKWNGVGYAFTRDNQLPDNWLLQTPNVWGMPADKVPIGAGKFVADELLQLITSAQQFIDITTLHPYPDGEFEKVIRQGLKTLAHAKRHVIVRILGGWSPIDFGENQRKYLERLITDLKPIEGAHLQIYVGAQRTTEWSWNHAKMVAVDGRAAMVGGENLWAGDYLQSEPVHDLNIALNGSIVYYMHKFTDYTWKNVCSYVEPGWHSVYWASGDDYVIEACLAESPVTKQPGPGKMPVLGAGRYGSLGDVYGNPADVAMLLCFSYAQSSIYIAQQDIIISEGPLFKGWHQGMKELAKALIRGVNVYIVISNDYAKAGSGNSYSASTVHETAKAILHYVKEEENAPIGDKLVEMMCSRLHLSTLRFSSSKNWPNGYEFANHAKFFMIDDTVFYVGSENLYPSDLIEYGVFISDPDAVKTMKTKYWDPLWYYSKAAAISGSDAPTCVYK